MKNKHIVIAAGTGFLGSSLASYFSRHNHITILTRQLLPDTNRIRHVQWDAVHPGSWASCLEKADMLINLAGRSVNCRYTAANKALIMDSRVNATRALGTAIQQLKYPPALWINAGSATIYRHAEDRAMNEYNGEMVDDFSTQVCKQWEAAFDAYDLPHTRKIVLRIAIALGWQPGGAMHPYLRLAKCGLGGNQGHGRQMCSWVHITDVCRMVEWLYDNEQPSGVFNCAAPGPVPNKVFMQAVRQAVGAPFGLPAPTPLLKMGAALIGTETELVLKSRWVLPEKALRAGFAFRFPAIQEALSDIVAHLQLRSGHTDFVN